jgi:hypothetical protein
MTARAEDESTICFGEAAPPFAIFKGGDSTFASRGFDFGDWVFEVWEREKSKS